MEKVAAPALRDSAWRMDRWLPLVVGLLWAALLAAFAGDAFRWGVSHLRQGLSLLVSIGALYLVPGLLVQRYAWMTHARSWPQRVAVALGIGVALPPLLLLLAALIRLPWNRVTTIGYVLLAAIALLASSRRNRDAWRDLWRRSGWRPATHGLIFSGLIAVALLARMYVVRDLPVGQWGDSYQHTMMAQLLVDNAGLFTSWQPYAPLVSFTYHFGFHANVAFFHWLTGAPVTHSVLLVGQILNVAALTGAYALTTRLTGSRIAGLWALALTGFYNTLPAFYVNWGRYTQLTGQVILPILLLAWIALLEAPRRDWRRIALAAVLTACLMLTHYIVTIFAALLVGAYLLALLLRARSRPEALTLLSRAAIAAAIALALALPWLINTLDGNLKRNVAGFVSQQVGAERIASEAQLPALPPLFLKGPILLLAACGLLLALRRRKWRAALPVAWTLLMLLVVMPHVVGLPGSGVVNAFTASIALYVPVIPLAAYALGVSHTLIGMWRPRAARWLTTAALIVLSVWGARWQQRLIDPYFQLFTPADDAAMRWIREHTPPEAVFHVNMFPAYGGSLFAGSDGGWWIPLLTGRASTLPPLTYGSERGEPPDLYRQVNELGYALREHPLPSDEGIRLLRARGVTHVYLGAHVGQADPIDAAALRDHPAFRVVYEQDGVIIFELRADEEARVAR